MKNISSNDINWDKLNALRSKVFAHIKKCLEEDGHCKSYEGIFEIAMPSYFSDRWVLKLHCYLIGPGRHHEWVGNSIDEAIEKAEKDIDYWCENNV